MKTKLCRNTPGRARRGQAAFSVTEAAVGMGVLGICISALFSGFTTGFFTMRMARENLRATQILLQKTETLRLYSWDQINSPSFVPTTFTERYDPNAPGSEGLTYYGTVRVAPCPISSSYSNDLRQVTITLNWKTGGISRNRTFSTFVARNGLQNYVY
jgi:type II secretory pathway pseudopilin PulG